jgi:hypothetical protein
VNDNSGPCPAGRGLFITWCTSVADGADHAVTDEEFAARRGAPVALCGVAVEWGPMELPPSPLCPACRTALRDASAGAILVRHTIADPDAPCGTRRPHRVAARLCRALAFHPIRWFSVPRAIALVGQAGGGRASSTVAVPPAGDRPEPPAALRSRLDAAGAPAGEGTPGGLPVACVSSPALFVPATVSVTDGRHAAQPSLPSTDPGAVSAGLGGPNSSAARSLPAAAEAASAGDAAAGTVVPPCHPGPRRDDHQLPAAAPSAVYPEGRDTGRQDEHRPWGPRRCVLLAHPTIDAPVEIAQGDPASPTVRAQR